MAVVGRIDGVFLVCQIGEQDRHVLRHFEIHGEQIGDVEAAIGVGIPPGEQKVRHPPALAAIVAGDVQQFFERKSDPVFHLCPSPRL
jgi:hypothetical protein